MSTKSSNNTQFDVTNDWLERLIDQTRLEYFTDLCAYVEEERQHHNVYPAPHNVFAALQETAFSDTRIVVLGQDPYHGKDQAHGLSFSVQHHVAIPPSLINIFNELENDLKVTRPVHGCLTHWAQQGVLLLNTTLTVRAGEPGSHHGKGWERFTDHIISLLNDKPEPVAFVLWGNHARRKKALISAPHHIIIEAPHPSPLSAHRGFFGSRPFSALNEFLAHNGYPEMSWVEEPVDSVINSH